MVSSPWLVEDQITLERQLNLQTLQRQKEDPFQVAHDQLRHQLYGDGPYGHDPLGVEAELAQLGREQLQLCTQQLGQGGAVLVLAGQLPEQPERLLLEGLGGQGWSTQAPVRHPGAPGLKQRSLASLSLIHISEPTRPY